MSLPNAEASSSKHNHKHSRDASTKVSKSKSSKHAADSKKSSKKSSSKKTAAAAADGPFEHRVQHMRLSVPPKFSADWLEGVRETLNSMLMQYVGQLGGVLLAHWEHEFADDTVKLINECPFGVVEVQFHSIVWAPKVGQLLSGTHSLSSPSHLSLLFSKTFNVSIPLNHIPQDKYEFEHTDEGADEDDMSSDDESDDGGLSTPSAVHEVGRWKDKSTGAILGSAGERVAFTVIGMQVTNNMLSLTGSLLADPSKAPAMPTVVASAVARSPSPDLPEPPAKRQATAKVAAPRAIKAPAAARKSAAPPVPEVDTSNMNARELKKFRKEQDKLKRDARKARKGDAGGGDEEKEDADARDLEVSTGGKRKAEDQGGERKKKRTD